MKKSFTLLLIFLILGNIVKAQLPIGYYDFEDNGNRNSASETSIQEAVSTLGAPSITVSSLTSSDGAGNAANYGSGSNGYAIGYYGFTTNVTSAATNPSATFGPFNCAGFSTLTLSLDYKGIGAKMPANVDVYYSINGTTYTRIVTTTTVSTSYQTKVFTIPTAANNAATLYLRVIGFGAGASPTSTDGVLMLDNFTLNSALMTANTTLIDANLHGTGLASGDTYLRPYTSLTVNGAGISVNAASDIIFNGRLTLTAGIFDIGNNTLTFQNGTIATPIARTSGTITVGASANIVFGPSQFSTTTTLPNTMFTSSPASFAGFKVDIGSGNVLNLSNNPIALSNNLEVASGIFAPNNALGTISVGGDLILNNSTITTTANVTVSGNVTGIGTQTITSVGKIVMNGASSTLSSNVTYDNVEINSAGNISLLGSTTFTGIITLTAGNLIVGAGNTLNLQSIYNPIAKTGGFITLDATSNLTFNTVTSTATFTMPNNAFTAPTTLNNLTINRSLGIIVWGNNPITVSGNLVINSAMYINNASGIVNVNGNVDLTSTTLTMSAAGATLNIAGNLNMSSGTVVTSTASSVINVTGNVTGTGLQSITSAGKIAMLGSGTTLSNTITYDNVEINSAGNVSLTGNTTFTGVLSLTNGNIIFGANTVNFNVAGNITKGAGFATLDAGTSLVFGSGTTVASVILSNGVFNGSSTISSLEMRRSESGTTSTTVTWGNNPLTISGNLTIVSGTANTTFSVSTGGLLTVNGNLVFTSSTGVSILATTANVTVNGDVVVSAGTGRHTGAGKIIMTGKGSVANLAGMQYANVELNSSNNFALGGSSIFTGSLTLTSGSLTVGANTLTFHSSSLPIVRTAGTITLASNSNLTFGITGFTAGNAFIIPNNTFTANPEFANLSVNRTNSLTLNNQNFAINGILLIEAGRLILPANHIFTLRSTSITNTAMVGTVGATGSIQYGANSGFRVERYIPQTGGTGIRAYRDVAPSVNTGTGTIHLNWQENGTNGLDNTVYYGTHITGVAGADPGGVDVTTGLDKTLSGNKSLYTNDVNLTTGDVAWNSVNSTKNTNDTLSAFKGYRLMIRGNRLVNLYTSPAPTGLNAPVTIRATGKLVTGDVAFTTTGVTANGATNTGIRLNSASATGYTMIGNPYASVVDWDLLHADATNISTTYTLFDANVGTSGGYATYNKSTGISVPGSSAINKYIQPGQAFFIQNTTTAPTLTFKESHKATNTANLTNTFRTANTSVSKIHFDIAKNIASRGEVILDGAAIAFNSSFSNTIGEEDAPKLTNGGENLCILSNNNKWCIEGRTAVSALDTVKLNIWQVVANVNYKLYINTTQFASSGLQIVLIDNFLNTQTILNANSNNTYSFTTSTNTASYNNRFNVVFRSNTALAVSFIDIAAAQKENTINVSWIAFERDIKAYEVERSYDAQSFERIATVNSKGNSGKQDYLFNDNNFAGTRVYYRIKANDINGKVTYSNIAIVKINNKQSEITVYPNPVVNKQMNILFNNMEKGNYNVQLFTLNGQLVYETTLVNTGVSFSKSISLANSVVAGNYLMKISSNDKVQYQKNIVVE